MAMTWRQFLDRCRVPRPAVVALSGPSSAAQEILETWDWNATERELALRLEKILWEVKHPLTLIEPLDASSDPRGRGIADLLVARHLNFTPETPAIYGRTPQELAAALDVIRLWVTPDWVHGVLGGLYLAGQKTLALGIISALAQRDEDGGAVLASTLAIWNKGVPLTGDLLQGRIEDGFTYAMVGAMFVPPYLTGALVALPQALAIGDPDLDAELEAGLLRLMRLSDADPEAFPNRDLWGCQVEAAVGSIRNRRSLRALATEKGSGEWVLRAP